MQSNNGSTPFLLKLPEYGFLRRSNRLRLTTAPILLGCHFRFSPPISAESHTDSASSNLCLRSLGFLQLSMRRALLTWKVSGAGHTRRPPLRQRAAAALFWFLLCFAMSFYLFLLLNVRLYLFIFVPLSIE